MKNKIIYSFFKSGGSQNIEGCTSKTKESFTHDVETSNPPEQCPSKVPRVESKQVDTSSLVRDLGLRK